MVLGMEHITTLGTCPICEREIAVESNLLVHHGYERPGHGRIVGDCFGAKRAPYEVSTTTCESYQRLRRVMLTNAQDHLAYLSQMTKVYFGEGRFGGPAAIGVTPLYTFSDRYELEIRSIRAAVTENESEISRMDRMIAEFEPRPLGSESRAGQKAREAREAREAERAAARAVKAAKAAKLTARKQAAAAKFEELKTQYRGLLEDLAANAEAQDACGTTAQRARELIAQMEKAMKKTPKVSCYMEDLGWDTLLVRLGVAQQLANGTVRHEFWRLG